MRKVIKIALITISLLIVLFIAGVYILLSYIGTDHFKTQISQHVEQVTGRTLTMDGDVSLSVFPWLGASISEVSLANAEGFSDPVFAHIGEAAVKLKVLPLFWGKAEVGTIVLRDMQLNLERNAAGATNWDDLMLKDESLEMIIAEAPDSDDVQVQLFVIDEDDNWYVAGISIENASVVWTDRLNNTQYSMTNFSAHIDEFSSKKPFSVKIGFHVDSSKPELKGTVNLSGSVGYNPAIGDLNIKNFHITTVLEGAALPASPFSMDFSVESVDLNYLAQTANIKQAYLGLNGLDVKANITATQFLTNANVVGDMRVDTKDLRGFLKTMGQELDMQGNNALKAMHAKWNFKANSRTFATSEVDITIDSSHIKGHFAVKDFETQAIDFNLNIDALDLSQYQASSKPSKPSASSGATGGAKGSESAKKPAASASKTTPSQTESPLHALRKLNLNGKLTIGRLAIDDMLLSNVAIVVAAKNGLVELVSSKAEMFEGQYEGTGSIDVREKLPKFRLNGHVNDMSTEKLLKKFGNEVAVRGLTGRANTSFNVAFQGDTPPQVLQTLSGDAKFAIRSGTLYGADLPFHLRQLSNETIRVIAELVSGLAGLVGQANSPGVVGVIQSYEARRIPVGKDRGQTPFSEISVDAKFKSGNMANTLSVKAPEMNIVLNGNLQMLTHNVNYRLNADVRPPEGGEFVDVPILLRVQGNLNALKSDPKSLIAVDEEGIKKEVEHLVNAAIENSIADNISRALGGGANTKKNNEGKEPSVEEQILNTIFDNFF